MKVVVLVLSALVLASLHHKVHGQCGTWMQSPYSVGEGDNFLTITAQFSSASSEQRFLQWSTRAGSAIGNQEISHTDAVVIQTPSPFFHIIVWSGISCR